MLQPCLPMRRPTAQAAPGGLRKAWWVAVQQQQILAGQILLAACLTMPRSSRTLPLASGSGCLMGRRIAAAAWRRTAFPPPLTTTRLMTFACWTQRLET
jgi:hypothetical protein